MTSNIAAAIAIRLHQIFGVDYEIYTDTVEQGLKEPCFFILCLNQSKEPLSQFRFKRQNTYDIHYFPKSTKAEEVSNVTDCLFDGMSFIQTNSGLIRGTKMQAEVTDGILHFQVQYNYICVEELVQNEPMEKIEVDYN